MKLVVTGKTRLHSLPVLGYKVIGLDKTTNMPG